MRCRLDCVDGGMVPTLLPMLEVMTWITTTANALMMRSREMKPVLCVLLKGVTTPFMNGFRSTRAHALEQRAQPAAALLALGVGEGAGVLGVLRLLVRGDA